MLLVGRVFLLMCLLSLLIVLANDVTGLKESEEKLKQQQQESARRENILVMRLATKEQEMQECTVCICFSTYFNHLIGIKGTVLFFIALYAPLELMFSASDSIVGALNTS